MCRLSLVRSLFFAFASFGACLCVCLLDVMAAAPTSVAAAAADGAAEPAVVPLAADAALPPASVAAVTSPSGGAADETALLDWFAATFPDAPRPGPHLTEPDLRVLLAAVKTRRASVELEVIRLRTCETWLDSLLAMVTHRALQSLFGGSGGAGQPGIPGAAAQVQVQFVTPTSQPDSACGSPRAHAGAGSPAGRSPTPRRSASVAVARPRSRSGLSAPSVMGSAAEVVVASSSGPSSFADVVDDSCVFGPRFQVHRVETWPCRTPRTWCNTCWCEVRQKSGRSGHTKGFDGAGCRRAPGGDTRPLLVNGQDWRAAGVDPFGGAGVLVPAVAAGMPASAAAPFCPSGLSAPQPVSASTMAEGVTLASEPIEVAAAAVLGAQTSQPCPGAACSSVAGLPDLTAATL